jgi:hypothetical protein
MFVHQSLDRSNFMVGIAFIVRKQWRLKPEFRDQPIPRSRFT